MNSLDANRKAGRKAAIIGGGVIGVACAHYLLERGYSVTIVEKGKFGAACSHGNCGFVSPSHVLPLAEPGAIGKTLRAMLSRHSPFSIRPRLDWALWSWLWKFARRCNRANVLTAGRAIAALLNSSMKLYEEVIPRHRIECEWQKKGLLFVFKTPQAMEAYGKVDSFLRTEFQEGADRLDGAEVCKLEGALVEGLAGAWYYEHDAHLRADRLLASWRKHLESNGAVVREGIEFRSFVPATNGENGNGARAAAAATSGEEIEADHFVFATGAWTPLLARELGGKIPIQPGKGYSITMPRPAVCPTIPMLFPEHRVGATPFEKGFRLGSIMEFAGYDESLRPERLALLRDGASHYLRTPYCDPIEEQWFGWRPMTYDSLPIIDRSPRWSNVWIAAGHNMLGLSMATGTGRLIGELLSGETPHLDPSPYRISRFG